MKEIFLESDRLILSSFKAEDSFRLADLCNDIEIYRNNLSMPYPYSLEDAKDWLAYLDQAMDPNRFMVFAIRDKKDQKLMGCISLELSQIHKRAEVGYWLGQAYWNQGFMTEALKRIIAYVFEERKYHRIYGSHFPLNKASGRVMEKAGMVYEGTLKGHLKKQDQYIDLVCYGLTKENYKK
ncbi:MAG: GNAT family protein [Bacillota bacterium]|nr:GNAT family protein [Bacillota bacterium]